MSARSRGQWLATGVEGSFRIEAIPVLREIGTEKIGARFDFPSGGQADLQVERQGHVSVLEFMCLVEWADAEKLRRFPKQLDRLSDRRKSCPFRRPQRNARPSSVIRIYGRARKGVLRHRGNPVAGLTDKNVGYDAVSLWGHLDRSRRESN